MVVTSPASPSLSKIDTSKLYYYLKLCIRFNTIFKDIVTPFHPYLISLSKRKGNRDLVMAKLKEGNINAATEMFQVLKN